MTLGQIKAKVLEVPGTYEDANGTIRYLNRNIVISDNGDINHTAWHKNTLKHEVFKFCKKDFVRVQELSEDLQNEFIQIVWDFHKSDDFKDNMERLKYVTGVKVRLANCIDELTIGEFGELKWKDEALITCHGILYDIENLQTIPFYKHPRKQHYIEFEEKVQKHFNFNFQEEFDKLEEKYEMFKQYHQTKSTLFFGEGYRFSKNGNMSIKMQIEIGFEKIETKEQFATFIKYLNFYNEQHEEKQEFLKGIK